MRKFVSISLLIFFCKTAWAQEFSSGRITFSVLNHEKQKIENASALLLKAKDSAVYKTALSDHDAVVEFDHLPAGNYIVRISSAGYAENHSATINISELQPTVKLDDLILVPRNSNLKEVVVVSKKPFIQKLSDRIVVNVESSIISAGSSAMDVLERSPGVNIDQNDVISLRGKQGVIIMVDGKPSAMTGADLANYLRGLPSAAIDRIDIITNPSAKYDAAGNSGIIDIHMKKDQRLGLNGTFNTGYGQGVYPKTNTGTTFNYRNKKLNVFGNYNYAYRVGLNHLYIDRSFYDDGVYQGGDLKDNFSRSPISSHTARLGMDFFPTKKTIIGFIVNGNFNHYTRKNDNNSTVLDPQKQIASTFQSLATNNDHGNNMVANINFKHVFDSTGKELTADLDYGNYNSASLTRNASRYYKLDGSSQQPDYILDGDQNGELDFKTVKLDFVAPWKKGAKLETGFKTSFVSSDNDAKFFDVSTGVSQNDVNKTNHFIYHENNNAAYINYSKELKKFDFQLGLRGEQTNIKTDQKIGDKKFDSSYFQIFPSAFFNYHVKEDRTIGVSVSRRIDRPGYSELNPFLFLIDPTTYATGRPGLLPQLTWSYELSYTLKNLNFALNYSHTKNNQNITLARFNEVFPNIPSAANVTVQVPINLASSDYFGISVSAPISIFKWWNMINNANIYYQKFNGSFSGTKLNRGKPAADIRTNNSFSFKKGWSAELNGSFNSGGQDGFMVADPQWAVSAGVQKAILKTKGTLRFNMSDIFWTNLPKAVITYDNYLERWHAQRETRVANFTFTYRFGNNKVQAARRRTTGSEEERQRAQ
ncbi:MAG: outer membrane beta-barrel family protein [Ferruginibacter sp.]